MPVIDINAAKDQLSTLLEAAQRGEEVVISQDGQAVAQLVAVRPRLKLRQPGSMAGRMWIAEDFDAPLSDKILAVFEGR